MITLHLLLIVAALVCLGLAAFSVPTGRMNMLASAAFCIVLAVFLVR
jgi:hypothetical protein